ncbi:ABC transporter substrate-binding protein [Bdellovibrionota bacterium FG-2]
MAIILNKPTPPTGPIRIGIGGEWKSLHPGLQHTLWAGLVLSNQFDTLVGVDDQGILQPGGAKSWDTSVDYKLFTFKIDTAKRFSDGSTLKAEDFKRSWEESYRLEPKSANSSLLDVLYQIEGFEDFEKAGTISGILVVDEETLLVRFKKPFRMALEYFYGARLAAFRHSGDHLIGTGKYVIEEISPHKLRFLPNPQHAETSKLSIVELSFVPSSELKQSLAEDRLDAVAYTMGSRVLSDISKNPDLQVLPGPEAIHIILNVNGNSGHLFANPRLRRALQAILYQRMASEPNLIGAKEYFTPDPQIFLPIQGGRISDEEALQIIKEGEKFIPELAAASQKQPIVLINDAVGAWIREEFKKYGIAVSDKSRSIPATEYAHTVYQKSDYDLIGTTFSVMNGDPDGIYHALGKRGSILSPITFREEVGDLLEEGRNILQPDELSAHYKKVSRAALEQVPFVHMGFSRAVAIIKQDRVKVSAQLVTRNYGHVDIFELK